MAGRLAEKKVLLLGAGSVGEGIGNGRAMAILFSREGADVVGVDLNLAAAEETARMVRGEGREMIALAGDVTDLADLARIIDEAERRLGRIDILVNNVGGSIPGGPEEITPEQWDSQFRFNVDYVHNSTRLLAPRMAKQGGGAIVNISSIAGVRHLGHDLAAYAASKAALQQYSKVAAVRYAPQNVRINTVIPGLMFTPLVTARLAGQQAGGDAAALIAKRHAKPPMNRMGDAWDVAYAALYLASDEAKYVTGAEIMVDGGLSNTVR
jgi:NAD(P)-dependent dehydrogenase (short-subunit alcohol dehydrogenase family)